MITAMGRFAKIWMLGAVACATLVAALIGPSAAQGSWEQVDGPVYSASTLRNIELDGIHLGLTREQVATAMAARGFENLYPDDDGGVFRSPDGVRIELGYESRGGREIVDSFSYSIFDFRDPNFAARRDAIVASLGPPTRRTRSITEDGRMGATMRFVTDRRLIDEVALAGFCYVTDWRCTALSLHRDCRPTVRQVRSVVIAGGYGDNHVRITVDDYAARSHALLHDRAFLAQDTTGAICLVPSIH